MQNHNYSVYLLACTAAHDGGVCVPVCMESECDSGYVRYLGIAGMQTWLIEACNTLDYCSCLIAIGTVYTYMHG